jgi:hypothetical protein
MPTERRETGVAGIEGVLSFMCTYCLSLIVVS